MILSYLFVYFYFLLLFLLFIIKKQMEIIKNLSPKLSNNKLSIITGGGVSNVNKLFILLLGVIIIVVSSSGYYTKKHCLDKKIAINSRIVEFFMGFGVGLIFYILCDLLKIVSVPIIIILGLFLTVIGSVFINVYGKMKPECTEDTIGPELSMGLLGCGIGIITFALLYNGLNFIKNPLTKIRIIALITSIFIIIIPSVIINMINKCDKYDSDTEMEKIKSRKTFQIISLVLSILVFIGISVSFYFIPPI